MPTFSENFLRAYAIGTEAKARQERLRLEEEQQALQRQQFITQMQRMEEDRKTAAITRQQQDVLLQAKLMERVNRPTMPAGDGVGPPAPMEVQPLQVPLHGGGNFQITPLFRDDIQAAEEASAAREGERKVAQAVEQARALAPLQTAMEEQKHRLRMDEVIYEQRQISERQRKALEAEAGKKGDEAPTEQYLDHLLDAAQHRTLDLQRLGVKTYNALQKHAAAKGEVVPRQFSDRERKNAELAVTGLGAVLDMERIYNQDPGVLTAAAFPTSLGRRAAGSALGSPMAEEFETARKRAMDPEMRAATGAALNADEQKFYGNLQATLFNDPKSVKFKFNHLKAIYAVATGTPFSVRTPDGVVYKVTDPSNISQRLKVKHAIENGAEPVF